MQDLFFELIQVAIGRRSSLSRIPSADEWMLLYRMAQKQAVAGVCFYGVQQLPKEPRDGLSELLRMQWLALAAQIQARNELLNSRCVEVQRMLEENGMRGCILKGQGVAKLYSVGVCNSESKGSYLGLYRQSGDIDVWVDGSR